MQTLLQAMDWLEKYCYDEEKGLFGRYYYCETPLANSRGMGWDNATGAPANTFKTMYKGKNIVRSYDLYINLLNYSNYIMLASMLPENEGAKYLDKIDNYDYLGGELNINFSGKGEIAEIRINDQLLQNSLQIPHSMINAKKANSIDVSMNEEVMSQNILISSTLKLTNVEGFIYKFEGFGKNIATFKNLEKSVQIADENGEIVKYITQIMDNFTFIEFEGRGLYTLKLN